jgi:hypothetical protein
MGNGEGKGQARPDKTIERRTLVTLALGGGGKGRLAGPLLRRFEVKGCG